MEFEALNILISSYFGSQPTAIVPPGKAVAQQPLAQANQVSLGDGLNIQTSQGLENIMVFTPKGRDPAKATTMRDWMADAIKKGDDPNTIAKDAGELMRSGRAYYYEQGQTRPSRIKMNESGTSLEKGEADPSLGNVWKPRRSILQVIMSIFGLFNGPEADAYRERLAEYNVHAQLTKNEKATTKAIIKAQNDPKPMIEMADMSPNQQMDNQNANNQAASQNSPAVSNNNPAVSNNNPIVSNNNPIASNNNPIASNNNPIASNNNPAVSNNNPIASANPAAAKPYEWKGKGTVVGQSTPEELAKKKLAFDRKNRTDDYVLDAERLVAEKLTVRLKAQLEQTRLRERQVTTALQEKQVLEEAQLKAFLDPNVKHQAVLKADLSEAEKLSQQMKEAAAQHQAREQQLKQAKILNQKDAVLDADRLAAEKITQELLKQMKNDALLEADRLQSTKLSQQMKEMAAKRQEKVAFQKENSSIDQLAAAVRVQKAMPNGQITADVRNLASAAILQSMGERSSLHDDPQSQFAYTTRMHTLTQTKAFQNYMKEGLDNLQNDLQNDRFFDKFANHLMMAPTGKEFRLQAQNLSGLQRFCREPPTMLRQLTAAMSRDPVTGMQNSQPQSQHEQMRLEQTQLETQRLLKQTVRNKKQEETQKREQLTQKKSVENNEKQAKKVMASLGSR